MNTENTVVSTATYTEGTSAVRLDFVNEFGSLIKNRNNVFSIDLSKATLIEAMEAYQEHKRKYNKDFTIERVIGKVRDVQYATGVTFLPIDINEEFYNIAYRYWTHKEDGVRDLRPSTIQNYFQIISTALKFASRHKCEISETYCKFKTDDYEKTKVAIDDGSLSVVYYFDFDIKEVRKKIRARAEELNFRGFSFAKLKRVRDQFCLMCNLGQRYSDAIKIAPENFDDTGTVFRCTQQKTGGRAKVNIIDDAINKKIAIEILRKYNYTAPASGIDIVYSNRMIHIMLWAIGGIFNELVVTENKINGVLVKETVPKWQAITTHTCRRSLTTHIIVDNRLSIVEAMKRTGHKDSRVLSKYLVTD